MLAPVSPAALTISTSDGPEMTFFPISMVIGIGGSSSGVHQIDKIIIWKAQGVPQ